MIQSSITQQKELEGQGITQKVREVEEATERTVIEVERKARRRLRTFDALKHRNFRLFWFGQLVSLIGTWMQTIGQEWLVLQLTHSPLALGIVGALQFLPIMLFALFGGLVADRLPKRRVLLFTQSFAMLQAAVMAILVTTGHIQIWHVYILAFLLGCTNAIDMPSRQSFISELVGRDDLANAIGLNSSLFNMARIVGPGLGGLLIAWFGTSFLFVINAVSFVPVITGLALIDISRLYASPRRQAQPTSAQGTLKSLREGLSYIKQTPIVLLTIAVVGAVSLFGINFNVVLPLFATTILKVGPSGYGFLSSCYGIGSLVAALWIASRGKRPPLKQILLACIAFSVLEMVFSLSNLPALSFVLIALVGATQISFSAAANTTLQTMTPDHLRGRIMSVYTLVFVGSIPIGNLFTGGLANTFGASVSLLAGGAISLIAAIIGWFKRAPAEQYLEQSRTVRS
ncbi:MFS transporter [Ktedonospora formicarum]|uniref:MFS transporter n=1 Tax=Ktedonospora formicarum TaxID=2778364 RepID=A0A8J3HYV5_9CHLR|nr:MFS transporter [Ktedonospora formicarum]GHO43038.1 MFS transporter [Ktedonospora formicarum]